jgi:hypothetical protein
MAKGIPRTGSEVSRVRPAEGHGVAHPLDALRVNRRTVTAEYSADGAHETSDCYESLNRAIMA